MEDTIHSPDPGTHIADSGGHAEKQQPEPSPRESLEKDWAAEEAFQNEGHTQECRSAFPFTYACKQVFSSSFLGSLTQCDITDNNRIKSQIKESLISD